MVGKNIVDPRTGSITYRGTSEITKGNHNGMPSRTEAYLPTDERGHIQASSLSGKNTLDNVVPQSADLNHGGYYSMEQGERAALNSGNSIESEKTAFVSNQPGGRPDAFIVNDTITYADGQVQNVHLSFSNLTNAEQENINAESALQAADMFDVYANPNDTLRGEMSTGEYSDLMNSTDPYCSNINELYHEQTEISRLDTNWEFSTEEDQIICQGESWEYMTEVETIENNIGAELCESEIADIDYDVDFEASSGEEG